MAKTKLQTLIFPRDKYTRQQALDWSKEHGFKHYSSRVTKHSIRIRQFPPNQIERVLGTFNLGKDVKALYVKKKVTN